MSKAKPKLVVLDGHTLNPGDLDWQVLSECAEVEVYEHTAAGDLLARAQGAQLLLTNKTVIDRQCIAQLPQLKYIGVLATGTNVVDSKAAKQQGIVVTNVPAYGPDAVAQMVFAHILQHCQQVSLHDNAVKQGVWSRGRDFCFTLAPLTSLKDKVLGLVGYGDIGQQVANIALAFGMRVIISTPTPKTDLPQGISWSELDSVLTQADILSLHCPLTDDTKQLINPTSLDKLKPGCLLINTARGDLIDEAALAHWLNSGKGFAGLDVLSTEPPSADNPLLSASNVTITPHIAWATFEARRNLLSIAVDNVHGFLDGKSINCV
ncbi:D-2-hydroxyacid dehydrogenase [Shewanella sp. WXL01]|uniref:D-2-hydroxyacid dehydrogenase n=1 Tax=Shewanella sp. WXL01 TaxID=2709721 RepID=UPI0014383B4A|nr:D-2-hydroxyacid dehydrogenase [Shewanella sp. WXL01]NKF49650.1 D-2-hydroxyacid dehydrogenase [Shewanella sp. WXL01]